MLLLHRIIAVSSEAADVVPVGRTWKKEFDSIVRLVQSGFSNIGLLLLLEDGS
jgi:hypothetical protein